MKRYFRGLALGSLVCLMAACSSGPKGDAANGKALYAQCAGCHSMTQNNVGPMHCGLIGRPAGTVPGFDYSEAMKSSGLVWSPEILDAFLVSPISYVVGTKMGFAGFDNPTERADLIAYLQQVNNDATVCPKT